MADLKEKAARIVEALKARPELHAEVERQLVEGATPKTAFAVLMIEHEFGQRDEGYVIFPTWEAAEKAVSEGNKRGAGAPGQFFEHTGPHTVLIKHEVYALLMKHGRLASQSNGLPPKGLVLGLRAFHPKAP